MKTESNIIRTLLALVFLFVVVVFFPFSTVPFVPYANAPALSSSERLEVQQQILNGRSYYYQLKETGRGIIISGPDSLSCVKNGENFVTHTFDVKAIDRYDQYYTHDHTFIYSTGLKGRVMEKICPTW
jgi:hypothetical protein